MPEVRQFDGLGEVLKMQPGGQSKYRLGHLLRILQGNGYRQVQRQNYKQGAKSDKDGGHPICFFYPLQAQLPFLQEFDLEDRDDDNDDKIDHRVRGLISEFSALEAACVDEQGNRLRRTSGAASGHRHDKVKDHQGAFHCQYHIYRKGRGEERKRNAPEFPPLACSVQVGSFVHICWNRLQTREVQDGIISDGLPYADQDDSEPGPFFSFPKMLVDSRSLPHFVPSIGTTLENR